MDREEKVEKVRFQRDGGLNSANMGEGDKG